jgi:hypothetical protein
MPVKRISRGSRGTWLSGVLRSSFKTSVGGFVGGGSGYGGFCAELGLLEVVVDPSVLSSLVLSSDFGGVGGNRSEVSGNLVLGLSV